MTQDEIIPLPQYLNASYEGDDLYTGKQLIEYAKLVSTKEQERCCSIVFAQCESDNVAQRTVDAIRGKA